MLMDVGGEHATALGEGQTTEIAPGKAYRCEASCLDGVDRDVDLGFQAVADLFSEIDIGARPSLPSPMTTVPSCNRGHGVSDGLHGGAGRRRSCCLGLEGGGGERPRLGDPQQLERQVAVGARLDQGFPPSTAASRPVA